MIIVDDSIISDIVDAPIEINLIPLGIGMLVLAFGYVALLRWVTKDE
tara:strand:+ start:320 stop:460 length:141 start_codon:yes stop_codon:yes gene_type:complete